MYDVSANGANIPALGFGTFRIPEGDVRRILPEARNRAFPGMISFSPPKSGWTATAMTIFSPPSMKALQN